MQMRPEYYLHIKEILKKDNDGKSISGGVLVLLRNFLKSLGSMFDGFLIFI
jgi:hypothetical protein